MFLSPVTPELELCLENWKEGTLTDLQDQRFADIV